MRTKPINKKFEPVPFIISLAITLAIGFVASLFTRPEIGGWFAGLQKPWFNPPPWLFAPVWTTIYILIAIAAYLVWKHRSNSLKYSITRNIYLLQLFLNFSWSIVFFGMHQILGALVVILLLWASILFNFVWFNKYSKIASALLIPYFLWVTFAAFLNLYIYLLNS